jgi:hypothetical protein
MEEVTGQVQEVQPTIRFMDLPTEIRDHIYSFMFVFKDPVSPCRSKNQILDYIGLLQTSRQIYFEAIQMLYGWNTFKTRERPIWTSEEFLNLLICQRRDGDLDLAQASQVCLARYHLKRLYFPSQNMTIHLLHDLFSLLKHFPKLEYLRVVYVGSPRMKDMDVISACRELNQNQRLKEFVICKRISYTAAEVISWMLDDDAPRSWSRLETVDKDYAPNTWKNQDGVLHLAEVVAAPP